MCESHGAGGVVVRRLLGAVGSSLLGRRLRGAKRMGRRAWARARPMGIANQQTILNGNGNDNIHIRYNIRYVKC